MGKIISNKAVMVLAAIIAVIALAAGPFIVGSSNLIQTADAKEKEEKTKKVYAGYIFTFTCGPGCEGAYEVNTGNRGEDKALCNESRDARIADGYIVTQCEPVYRTITK